MKNELIDSESNYSRLGKYFGKKYLYLFNRKDYISNLQKILAKKQVKDSNDEFFVNKDIFNSTSQFDTNIFDINYINEHDQIIEKQMKKYLAHKDKYKYHLIHVDSNGKRKKVPQEGSKLLLFSNINTDNDYSLLKRRKEFHSFDKINERKSNKKDVVGGGNKNNIASKNNKDKNIEIIKIRKNSINNKILKQKIEKENYKTMNKNELSHRNLTKITSLKTNLNTITNFNKENNKTISPKSIQNSKISIKKIHLNKKQKKESNLIPQENNYQSLDNKRQIRCVNFSKMLSRKTKKNKNENEISNICSPITPKYDIIYPKTVVNFLYKEKIPRKDFSPKYRKYDYEFFLDYDKVYNKYNNHRESQSFSLDKICGRERHYQNMREESKCYQGPISDRNIRDIKINKDINNIIKLFINNNLNSKSLNQYGYNNTNDYLENIYKKIINNILDKEKKSIEEARLKKIINGKKINANYKKLFNLFIEHKFLNYINKEDYSHNLNN